jgi:hypothetical protein
MAIEDTFGSEVDYAMLVKLYGQGRLGHASIQITLDTYSHVAPGLQQAATVRFDEAFSPRYNEPENEVAEVEYQAVLWRDIIN